MVFSGANERALIAICRSFAARRVPCAIVARPGEDPMRLTKYRTWIATTRGSDALDLDDMLACVAQLVARHPGQSLTFLPTAESINRLVLEHRDRFEQAGLRVRLVDADLYVAVSDKARLLALAEGFGLPAPPSLEAPTPQTLPLVAKPKTEFAPDGRKLYPELIFDTAALQAFQRNADPALYFFQTYLEGASYYYLAHFAADGTATFAYQRNLLQQANGKSIIAAELCTCPDLETREKLTALFRSVNYRGYAMIETMEIDGRHYLIEVNPRFWGPWSLAERAGFKPEAFAGTCAPLPPGRQGAGYLWMGGWLMDWGRRRRVRVYPAARALSWPRRLGLLAQELYLRRDTFRLFLNEARTAIKLRLANAHSLS
ncbi:hypothetical protein [Pseudoxanthomonas sp. JBR18]|uniref:hypothetical protein n=1 Tax=Pseudoxanthomonas sp. JBR18 TaxID=2969308 RepID=UPI0023054529|nr:hypothetical protein [Pseudoxanthomonas sp. JBR18]WCE03216.1 hypothetical protein PJ250_13990 [Pseudoxanthomonas sp. JBR18]